MLEGLKENDSNYGINSMLQLFLKRIYIYIYQWNLDNSKFINFATLQYEGVTHTLVRYQGRPQDFCQGVFVKGVNKKNKLYKI